MQLIINTNDKASRFDIDTLNRYLNQQGYQIVGTEVNREVFTKAATPKATPKAATPKAATPKAATATPKPKPKDFTPNKTTDGKIILDGIIEITKPHGIDGDLTIDENGNISADKDNDDDMTIGFSDELPPKPTPKPTPKVATPKPTSKPTSKPDILSALDRDISDLDTDTLRDLLLETCQIKQAALMESTLKAFNEDPTLDKLTDEVKMGEARKRCKIRIRVILGKFSEDSTIVGIESSTNLEKAVIAVRAL